MEGTTETTPEEPQLCEFYLRGSCHFGDKCRNLHDGSIVEEKQGKKSKKAANKNTAKNAPKDDKRRKMRTALDVIKRVQWDEALPQELFTIGYLDRFAGVVVSVCFSFPHFYLVINFSFVFHFPNISQEDPFEKFSHWCDLASVCEEDEVLAIPQHRIQYFKYRDTKVWDKNSRLDLIFGSTSPDPNHDIEQILTEIDVG